MFKDKTSAGATLDFGQFHRGAADIADQTVSAGPAEQHALGGQAGFFFAVDNPDFEAREALDLVAEVAAIGGVAYGGGGHHGQL